MLPLAQPLPSSPSTPVSTPDKVMHSSVKLKARPHSVPFFCSCDNVFSQTGTMLSFVFNLFTRSKCHLTIITLIHWIKKISCTCTVKMIKIDSRRTVYYLLCVYLTDQWMVSVGSPNHLKFRVT